MNIYPFITISIGVINAGMLLYLIVTKKNEKKNIEVELRSSETELRSAFNQQLSQVRLDYESTINEIKLRFEKQISILKDDNRVKVKNEFDNGYNAGLRASNVTVEIIPYREVVKDNGIFFKEEIVLIGYKYQLFCNGIPCLQPHTEIIENLYIKDIKEETVNRIIQVLKTVVSQLPYGRSTGSLSNFGKELLKLRRD